MSRNPLNSNDPVLRDALAWLGHSVPAAGVYAVPAAGVYAVHVYRAPTLPGTRGASWIEAAQQQKAAGEARRAEIAAHLGLDPKTGDSLVENGVPAPAPAPDADAGAHDLAGEGDGYGSDFSL